MKAWNRLMTPREMEAEEKQLDKIYKAKDHPAVAVALRKMYPVFTANQAQPSSKGRMSCRNCNMTLFHAPLQHHVCKKEEAVEMEVRHGSGMVRYS